MVSAVHVGGRRLHELAREGVEVERAPRAVHVDGLRRRRRSATVAVALRGRLLVGHLRALPGRRPRARARRGGAPRLAAPHARRDGSRSTTPSPSTRSSRPAAADGSLRAPLAMVAHLGVVTRRRRRRRRASSTGARVATGAATRARGRASRCATSAARSCASRRATPTACCGPRSCSPGAAGAATARFARHGGLRARARTPTTRRAARSRSASTTACTSGTATCSRGCASSPRRAGSPPSVVTFDPHPASVVAPERAPRCSDLGRAASRAARPRSGSTAASSCGFDETVATEPPAASSSACSSTSCAPRSSSSGRTSASATTAPGDVALLRARSRASGASTSSPSPSTRAGGEPISSSRIRATARRAGDVAAAAALLGRPHELEGRSWCAATGGAARSGSRRRTSTSTRTSPSPRSASTRGPGRGRRRRAAHRGDLGRAAPDLLRGRRGAGRGATCATSTPTSTASAARLAFVDAAPRRAAVRLRRRARRPDRARRRRDEGAAAALSRPREVAAHPGRAAERPGPHGCYASRSVGTAPTTVRHVRATGSNPRTRYP